MSMATRLGYLHGTKVKVDGAMLQSGRKVGRPQTPGDTLGSYATPTPTGCRIVVTKEGSSVCGIG